LALTVLTLGIWSWVWLFAAIATSRKHKQINLKYGLIEQDSKQRGVKDVVGIVVLTVAISMLVDDYKTFHQGGASLFIWGAPSSTDDEIKADRAIIKAERDAAISKLESPEAVEEFNKRTMRNLTELTNRLNERLDARQDERRMKELDMERRAKTVE
jgi:hypothetical protein